MLKYAMNIGAITGLALVLVKVLAFAMGMNESFLFESISYIVLIGGLVYGIKNYRDGHLEGFINYEKCLGLGTLISVGSSIIFAFFLYIYFTMIDASLIDTMITRAQEEIYNDESLTDEQIETAVEAIPVFIGPGVISFTSFLAFSFVGFIFSLIVSFFLKKPAPFPEAQ